MRRKRRLKWLNACNVLPKKEGYYSCVCLISAKPVKCKFRKGKNGPYDWCPDMFIHKGRVPFVVYWKEKRSQPRKPIPFRQA